MKPKTVKILLAAVMVLVILIGLWVVVSDIGGAEPAGTPEDPGAARETAQTPDGGEDPAPSEDPEDAAGAPEDGTPQDAGEPEEPEIPDEDGTYTSRDEVAAYLHWYGHLPSNFLTKDEARDLGWDSSLGNLDEVAPGMSIGGDRFGNREGLLPSAPGRQYYECDIDYDGGFRNGKRIVWSSDGLIYYTEDHYETFVLLYGGDT